MRLFVLLVGTSILAACGGGGEKTISSTPPPPVGGGGSNNGGGTANTTHTFADPKEAKTYQGIGGSQVYEYTTDKREISGSRGQQQQVYAANSTTARNSSITLSYNPADAVYELVVNDSKSGAAVNTRFQDPANRTDFDGIVEPQWGTPNLENKNISYLQAGDGTPRAPYDASGSGYIDSGSNTQAPFGTPDSSYQSTTLFVLEPGKETQFVTYAGYLRNSLSFSYDEKLAAVSGEGDAQVESPDAFDATNVINWHLERGAFAYGQLTANSSIPTTGSGSYAGSMLATMIYNPTIDGQDISGTQTLPSYFQWIEGTSNLAVDFAANAFTINLNGTVRDPQLDKWSGPKQSVLSQGAQFTASGKGDINLVNYGGFKGFIDSAKFTQSGSAQRDVAIAGSTVDGAFYGPNGEEVGGGFRVVGGTPDERIDILGAFVGKK